jgi:hypothetical protein
MQWRLSCKDFFQVEPIRQRILRVRNHSRTYVPAVS